MDINTKQKTKLKVIVMLIDATGFLFELALMILLFPMNAIGTWEEE